MARSKQNKRRNKRNSTTTSATLTPEVQQQISDLKCAMEHLRHTHKTYNMLFDLLCSTPQKREIQLKKLIDRTESKTPFATKKEEIEFLIACLQADEAKEKKDADEDKTLSARPYTKTFIALNEIKESFNVAQSEESRNSVINNHLRLGRHSFPIYRDALLAAEIGLKIKPTKNVTGFTRYDLSNTDTAHYKPLLPGMLSACGIKNSNEKIYKGLILKLSKKDNEKFIRHSLHLPPKLSDLNKDPLDVLQKHNIKIKDMPKTQTTTTTTESKDRFNIDYMANLLNLQLAIASEAQEIYNLGKSPYKDEYITPYIDDTIHLDRKNPKKLAYLRKQAEAGMEKIGGTLEGSYLESFINDLEKAKADKDTVRKLIHTTYGVSIHIGKVFRGAYIMSRSTISYERKNKLTRYYLQEHRSEKQLKKALATTGVKVTDIEIEPEKPNIPQRVSLLFSESKNHIFKTRSNHIQNIVNDRTKDPIEALLKEYPYALPVEKPKAAPKAPEIKEDVVELAPEVEEEIELLPEEQADVDLYDKWIWDGYKHTERMKKQQQRVSPERFKELQESLEAGYKQAITEAFAPFHAAAIAPLDPENHRITGDIDDPHYVPAYDEGQLPELLKLWKKTPHKLEDLKMKEGIPTKLDDPEGCYTLQRTPKEDRENVFAILPTKETYLAVKLTKKGNPKLFSDNRGLTNFSAQPSGKGYTPFLTLDFKPEANTTYKGGIDIDKEIKVQAIKRPPPPPMTPKRAKIIAVVKAALG